MDLGPNYQPGGRESDPLFLSDAGVPVPTAGRDLSKLQATVSFQEETATVTFNQRRGCAFDLPLE